MTPLSGTFLIERFFMRDAETMTPQELRALAEMKEQEDRVVRRGELKHDLYSFNDGSTKFDYMNHGFNDFYFSEETKGMVIDKFISLFEPVLKKGTPFVAYYDKMSDCCNWYDDVGYGIEDKDDDWAKEHLTNIVYC